MHDRLNVLWSVSARVALILLASGCATSYQSNGFTGGYSDTRLAPDVFRINFTGNAYTSAERAQDFALLRAADLTLQHGFKCFAVVDETASTQVSSFTTPGTATTTGTAYVSGGYGSYYGSYSANTTYTPPQTQYFFKPRSGLLIKCFAEQPEKIYIFDAAFLQQSIREKYKIKPPSVPNQSPSPAPAGAAK